jgi:hypothetical protein
VVGGSFLRRTLGRARDDEGNLIDRSNFFVGATLRLVAHSFLLKGQVVAWPPKGEVVQTCWWW